jgi:glc operon protein GlcG
MQPTRQSHRNSFSWPSSSWFLISMISSTCCLLNASPYASAQPPSADAPLISRQKIDLHLAGAETILRAAQEKANEMDLRVNIAVVDSGGHLLAFARMDGARPASVATALTKATTAATLRQATGPLPPGSDAPNVLLNLSIQNAAAASGGKFTTLFGGVPIIVEDQVIGAVGVGGATGEQDAEIARAGIDALLEAVN